jgi:hypothetical protein
MLAVILKSGWAPVRRPVVSQSASGPRVDDEAGVNPARQKQHFGRARQDHAYAGLLRHFKSFSSSPFVADIPTIFSERGERGSETS